MSELIHTTRASLPPAVPAHTRRTAQDDPGQRGGVLVAWARHQDEVRLAQRLRHQVFATEMGARLDETVPGHDIGLFDERASPPSCLSRSSLVVARRSETTTTNRLRFVLAPR